MIGIGHPCVDEYLEETFAPRLITATIEPALLTVLQAEADPGLKCCEVRVLNEQVFKLRIGTRRSYHLHDCGRLDHTVRKKTINVVPSRRITVENNDRLSQYGPRG